MTGETQASIQQEALELLEWPRLAQHVASFASTTANNVNRRFTFSFQFIIQWNVSHFFTWIKQGVLCTLAENILSSSHENRKHQWCSSK